MKYYGYRDSVVNDKIMMKNYVVYNILCMCYVDKEGKGLLLPLKIIHKSNGLALY